MIEQECIGIPDMILLLMIFFVSKKIKIKAEIVLSPGGAYFATGLQFLGVYSVSGFEYPESSTKKKCIILIRQISAFFHRGNGIRCIKNDLYFQDSWVGKWQRINKCVQGMYAISVSGSLPRHIVQELRSHGIVYRSRDTSQK